MKANVVVVMCINVMCEILILMVILMKSNTYYV